MDLVSAIMFWLSGVICGFGLFLLLVFRPEITRASKTCSERTKDYILDKKLDLKLWIQKRNQRLG
jgi:hypothetical protein